MLEGTGAPSAQSSAVLLHAGTLISDRVVMTAAVRAPERGGLHGGAPLLPASLRRAAPPASCPDLPPASPALQQCVVDGVTGARIADRFHPDVRIGGFHQTADKAGRDYDARRVVATAVHPGFKFGDPSSDDWFNNDIALLLLGAPSSKALPNLPAQLGEATGVPLSPWARACSSPHCMRADMLTLSPLPRPPGPCPVQQSLACLCPRSGAR